MPLTEEIPRDRRRPVRYEHGGRWWAGSRDRGGVNRSANPGEGSAGQQGSEGSRAGQRAGWERPRWEMRPAERFLRPAARSVSGRLCRLKGPGVTCSNLVGVEVTCGDTWSKVTVR